jgi:hypothetical protein
VTGQPARAGAPLAPVETKTAAAAAVSTVTGVVTWVLVSWIPAFHAGLPPALATFLPFIIASVLGTAASWMAPHTPRPADSQVPAR